MYYSALLFSDKFALLKTSTQRVTDRQSCFVLDLFEGKAGFNIFDAGYAREIVKNEALKGLQIRDNDTQQIIFVACH